MEYLVKCPKCLHHGILKTIKKIPHSSTTPLPQRNTVCEKCGAPVRATIIGERVIRRVQPNEIDPEIALEVQPNNRLVFDLWIQYYIDKSEFGFSSENKGESYLFGDLIDESNPKNDKAFKEALTEFLTNIPQDKRKAVHQQITRNWKRYIDYAIAEENLRIDAQVNRTAQVKRLAKKLGIKVHKL